MIDIKTIDGAVLYTSSTAGDVRSALQEAVMRGAYLSGAYLSGAYLSDAYLSGAYLSDAYLSDANLRGAYLSDANLSGAYLSGANLSDANLSGAYLSGANLSDAYLSGANLSDANLSGANLSDAYLSGAKNAELAIAKTRIIPDEGDVIGWKKARDGRIVKLRIPDGVRRSHASGRKCRAAEAVVLRILSGDEDVDSAVSVHDETFTYRVGETVTPTAPFDDDMWNECASGIHFFVTRLEAEAHL